MPPTQFNPTTITVNEAFEAYTQAHASGCPLVHSGAHGGFWLVVGFDEARSVLADHERFRSGPGVLFPDPGLPKNVPLEFDPPEHRALRAIFTDALTTPKVRATAIHIREHVDALIDTFAPRGTAELCAEYAGPLTLQTIATHVGIALPQLPEMQRVSEALLRSLETPDTRDEAAIADFSAFALELIQSRRAHPRDDPLTVLANAEVDGRTLNPDEAVGYFTGFLIAGHDTTRTSLCRLLDRVGRDDRLRTRLREHPEQTARVVEESLRLRPPFHFFRRTVHTACELAGQPLRPGEPVLVSFAAANRDPATFGNPDQFDPDRHHGRHLTFGHGIHLCAGATLARTQLNLGLTGLLRRLPDYRPTIDDPDNGVPLRVVDTMRTLPVVFTPPALGAASVRST
jgi:cytochrome P450